TRCSTEPRPSGSGQTSPMRKLGAIRTGNNGPTSPMRKRGAIHSGSSTEPRPSGSGSTSPMREPGANNIERSTELLGPQTGRPSGDRPISPVRELGATPTHSQIRQISNDPTSHHLLTSEPDQSLMFLILRLIHHLNTQPPSPPPNLLQYLNPPK